MEKERALASAISQIEKRLWQGISNETSATPGNEY